MLKTMLKNKLAVMLGVFVAATAPLVTPKPVSAVTLTFSGSFLNSNDTRSFFFAADGTSSVNIKSYSYSGGTSTNGTIFSGGGFNPIVTLFTTIANLPDQNFDDISRLPAGDISFSRVLPKGEYRAVLSVFPNFAEGGSFSDGFTNTNIKFDGTRNAAPDTRTGFYAFDISGNGVTATAPVTAAVPEPATIIGTFIAGCAIVGFKRKLVAKK
jgi:hypothetical protein